MTPEIAHKWIVDGIEEGMARIEVDGKRIITVPAYLLPDGATEGQILTVSRSAGTAGSVQITVKNDSAATAAALAASTARTQGAMTESRKRDPGGDVSL